MLAGASQFCNKYKCLDNLQQIDERIEIRDNTTNRVDMTPEEQQKIKINLQEIAAIF